MTLNKIKNNLCFDVNDNSIFFENDFDLFQNSNNISTGLINHLQTNFEFKDVIYKIHQTLSEYTPNVRTLFNNFSICRKHSSLHRKTTKKILKFSLISDFNIKNQLFIQKFLKFDDNNNNNTFNNKNKKNKKIKKQKSKLKNKNKFNKNLYNLIKTEMKIEHFSPIQSNQKKFIKNLLISQNTKNNSNKLISYNKIIFNKLFIYFNYIKKFQEILQQNPNFNVDTFDDNHNTLCIYACILNNYEILHLLIAKGANLNIQNNKGNTALHYSVSFKHFKIYNLLLLYNVDENIKNNNGETAWECLNKKCDL